MLPIYLPTAAAAGALLLWTGLRRHYWRQVSLWSWVCAFVQTEFTEISSHHGPGHRFCLPCGRVCPKSIPKPIDQLASNGSFWKCFFSQSQDSKSNRSSRCCECHLKQVYSLIFEAALLVLTTALDGGKTTACSSDLVWISCMSTMRTSSIKYSASFLWWPTLPKDIKWPRQNHHNNSRLHHHLQYISINISTIISTNNNKYGTESISYIYISYPYIIFYYTYPWGLSIASCPLRYLFSIFRNFPILLFIYISYSDDRLLLLS